MTLRARAANEDDLEAIAALTGVYRRRLQAWSPLWWRAAAGADEMHSFWVQHLIDSDGPVVRVVADHDVVGCAVSMPQSGQWFVDDMAIVDDSRWPDVGMALLKAIAERPALTCIPAADQPRSAASTAAGYGRVSSYWIRPTEGAAADNGLDVAAAPIAPGTKVPKPPPHTFGGALDPDAEDALAFATDDGGLVVGSPPTSAPPVYDPGGTVGVIDRIVGPNRAGLLAAALGRCVRRDDVAVAVVAAEHDTELEAILTCAGFERTVDVHCLL